jgi:hypothetical protein
MIFCGCVVASWKKLGRETLILSLHLCLVTLQYIPQLQKHLQSVTKKWICVHVKTIYIHHIIHKPFQSAYCLGGWPLLVDTCVMWMKILTTYNIVNCPLGYVTCPLKVRIVEPEEMTIARKWLVNTFLRQRIHKCNNRNCWRLRFLCCLCRLEYLKHSPASCSRRRKGNPLPGGITGPPCLWGI